MKVSDSRLDSIKSLVRKLSKKTSEVDSAQGVGEAGASNASQAAVGSDATSEVSAAGYGELHHSIEQKQLERDVRLVLGATDPAREKRIEELKARIDAGEYSVDPESVAERLLASGMMAEFD